MMGGFDGTLIGYDRIISRHPQKMTSEKLRQQFEGQLYKYTNVMKGWQYRWFILDPETGILNYFLNDVEHKQRPRGGIHLAGAVISPSDEDSNTFTVNSAGGDMFKLRAADARSRQEWVNRMRAVAEMHTMAIAQSNPPLSPREHHSVPPPTQSSSASSGPALPQPGSRVHCSLAVLDAFSTVREHIHRAEQSNFSLARTIEELPTNGNVRSIDPDLLLLKATSQATLLCLGQCLFILQQQQVTPTARSYTHMPLVKKTSLPPPLPPTAAQAPDQPPTDQAKKSLQHEFPSSVWPDPSPSPPPLTPLEYPDVGGRCTEEEVTDPEDEEDCVTAPAEEQRSMIVHLLSQLKLGMDLTRVVLPTFILERRSLLELFADCMGHPDHFLRINECGTAEERMIAVLDWYLTSFHMGRKGTVAKKPYNPIVGETFHCSWRVPGSKPADTQDVRYTAEQVSHHPPVTAFYVECVASQMCLNASIWTKSNFSGMSVGVNMVGDICLHLGGHGERYDFSLPAAYARSIINIPWIELGGKVTLNCQQTGYSANIVFHTKPFYGGKVNQVTAEVKDALGENVCKVQGEWNNSFEFIYDSGKTERVEVNRLSIFPKRVRLLSAQGHFESRKLWYDVTQALHCADIELATEYKRGLEDRQRCEERRRREQCVSHQTKYFHKVGDNWVFNKLLVNI